MAKNRFCSSHSEGKAENWDLRDTDTKLCVVHGQSGLGKTALLCHFVDDCVKVNYILAEQIHMIKVFFLYPEKIYLKFWRIFHGCIYL